MKSGMASLCIVGVLMAVGVTEGRAPTSPPDKATAAAVRKLQEKRRDLLRDAMAGSEKLYQAARGTMGEVLEASTRLLAAELELAATGADRIAVYERLLERAQALAQLAKAKQAAGRGTGIDVLAAQALCLEAEIGLLKSGGKVKKAKE